MKQTPDPIEAGLRAWAAGDLDALEILLAPEVSLRAVQPGPWDCTGREQVMALPGRGAGLPGARAPRGRAHMDGDHRRAGRCGRAGAVPHGTRITVADGLVTAMQQYRADAATV